MSCGLRSASIAITSLSPLYGVEDLLAEIWPVFHRSLIVRKGKGVIAFYRLIEDVGHLELTMPEQPSYELFSLRNTFITPYPILLHDRDTGMDIPGIAPGANIFPLADGRAIVQYQKKCWLGAWS